MRYGNLLVVIYKLSPFGIKMHDLTLFSASLVEVPADVESKTGNATCQQCEHNVALSTHPLILMSSSI